MPYETAFVSLAFLVGQHCHENGVWMDSCALDVGGVGDAVADVFGEGSAEGSVPPRRESGGRGRGRGRGRGVKGVAIWCNDSYFCCAEFA